MKISNFGQTWWGQQWLDALISTDYSNRLPRGKSYARNGYVKTIAISTKGTDAKVQGRRPSPYKISLSLPAFTHKEKITILDIITHNPLYLSSLLNRKLPEALYQDFEKQKVALFPKRWDDVIAHCSCPDWASCCKHIAAVIYMIANEIDRNPFLVFELHGLDIFAELGKRGFSLIEEEKQTIPHYDAWSESKRWQLDWEKVEAIDFSTIPFLQSQLLLLLEDKPVFCSSQNFKTIIEKCYKGVEKFAEKILADTELKHVEEPLKHASDILIKFNNLLEEKILVETKDIKNAKTLQQQVTLPHLQEFLLRIPDKKLKHQPDKIVVLHLLVHFALKLLQQGAFIPEIINVGKEKYRIRWLPALLNKAVRDTFQDLLAIVPSGIVRLKAKSIKREEALKLLLSLFLQAFISAYSSEVKTLDCNEQINAFFLAGSILETSHFTNKELPITIAVWLNRFYLTHKKYVPAIKVEEGPQGFSISILVENRQKPLDPFLSLEDIFKEQQHQKIALNLFKDLQLLGDYFPEIETILTSKGEKAAVFLPQEFPDVLLKQLPILKMLGIPLILPKGLENVAFPRLSLSVNTKKKPAPTEAGASYLSIQNLLEFDWAIALGDKHVNPKEFKKLLQGSKGIVKFMDQFVYFDEAKIKKILQSLDKEPLLSGPEKIRTILSGEYEGTKVNLQPTVEKVLAFLQEESNIPLPKTLLGKLRPYQLRGYRWLYKNAKLGFGSLIADDMGLGKTIQVIAFLLKLKAEKKLTKQPALIVVPTSLLTNWRNELEKFAPSLNVHIYHGTNREFTLKNRDVFITSYGLTRKNITQFVKYHWPVVIIDEAQNIKNHQTAQTKVMKMFKTDIRIAMTGTPVENRLIEYWSIIDFLNKGYLYNLETFKREFALPIEIERDRKQLETFRKMTTPFILRRVKSDKTIIQDLPNKIEMDQYNQLTKEQAALYQNVVDTVMEQIEKEEGIARKGLIFKLMTQLKQICNHPAHYQKKASIDPKLSGKTSILMELLETIYENGEKVLLFTQYTEMGNLLQTLIEKFFQTDVLFFHGGLSRKKRDEAVQFFQNDRTGTDTMILSLKAGGTGLNLTAAKHVIHFDLWWNPAVEAQATDRAYRIGQKENVMVYRMITKDTFEEKINSMINQKKELANLTVHAGEKWIGEFSNRELKHIFELGHKAS